MAISGVGFFKKKDAAEKVTETELEPIQSLKQSTNEADGKVEADSKASDKKPKHGEPGVCCGSCS